jgi:hypothetical protein
MNKNIDPIRIKRKQGKNITRIVLDGSKKKKYIAVKQRQPQSK